MKQRLTLLALLAVLTIARIALVDHLGDQGYFLKYPIFADQILSGAFPRFRLADLSPGYLWFIVALRALGIGVHAIRTLQIVMVSLAAWCCAEACKDKLSMFAAALLLIASRGALLCATDLEPETLILLLNALALMLFAKEKRVGCGFVLGLSAICRPVALLGVFALLPFPMWWRAASPARSLSPAPQAGEDARHHIGLRFLAAALSPIVIMLTINFALTNELVLMDPGTVFYEGMNPNATGYAGVQPKIVTDLQRASRDPDYLHVAYRIVAAKSLGHIVTRGESNRYWTAKSLAFVRAFPAEALKLTLRKIAFAFHSHESWDLVTMARKDALIPHALFIPFGFLIAACVAAGALARRDAMPYLLFAAANAITLIVFYVTARQRDAMLPALAIAGGMGLSRIITSRNIRMALVVIAATVLLSIDTNAQREDDLLSNAPPKLGPANEHTLAERAIKQHDERAREQLFALHDPFTAKAALYEAGRR